MPSNRLIGLSGMESVSYRFGRLALDFQVLKRVRFERNYQDKSEVLSVLRAATQCRSLSLESLPFDKLSAFRDVAPSLQRVTHLSIGDCYPIENFFTCVEDLFPALSSISVSFGYRRPMSINRRSPTQLSGIIGCSKLRHIKLDHAYFNSDDYYIALLDIINSLPKNQLESFSISFYHDDVPSW